MNLDLDPELLDPAPGPFPDPQPLDGEKLHRTCTHPLGPPPAACMTGMQKKEGACHWGVSLFFRAEGS